MLKTKAEEPILRKEIVFMSRKLISALLFLFFFAGFNCLFAQGAKDLNTLSDYEKAMLGTPPNWFENTHPKIQKVEPLNVEPSSIKNKVKLQVETPTGLKVFEVEHWYHTQRKPSPLLLTQWNHRGWAEVAFERGYNIILYPGADGNDASKTIFSKDELAGISLLYARALVGKLTLDFAYNHSSTQKDKIVVMGHSRNGKQSLYFAAKDKRVKVALLSSAGTGGDCDFDYTHEAYFTESVEEITKKFPQWFVPNFLTKVGNPLTTTVNIHGLMALAAPNQILVAFAEHDHQANPEGIIKTVQRANQIIKRRNPQIKKELVSAYGRLGNHHTHRDDIDWMLDLIDNKLFGKPMVHKPATEEYFFPDFERVFNNASKFKLRDTTYKFANPRLFPEREPFQHHIIDRNRDGGRNALKLYFEPYAAAEGYQFLWVHLPKNDSTIIRQPSKPVVPVIFLHGKTYSSGWRKFAALTDSLNPKGYGILYVDLPGFGSRNQYFKRSKIDEKLWLKECQNIVQSMVAAVKNNSDYFRTDKFVFVGYDLGADLINTLDFGELKAEVEVITISNPTESFGFKSLQKSGNRTTTLINGSWTDALKNISAWKLSAND